MKKFILLLIIAPLLFFNSCEEENNCPTEPIQCGEIINIEVYPEYDGTATPSGLNNGVLVIVGAHEGYSIITLRNCNTGNEGTYCTTLDFENDLGDVFCPNYNAMSQWGVNTETGCSQIVDKYGNLVIFN